MLVGIGLGILIAVASFYVWEKFRKNPSANLGHEILSFAVDIVQNAFLPFFWTVLFGLWKILLLIFSRLTKRRVFAILAALSLGMFTWGVYLFARDKLPELLKTTAQPVAQPTFGPITAPAPTPSKHHRPPPVPAPEPPPPVQFSIKQTGDQFYRVVIPPGRWVDTGVPAVAGTLIVVGDTEDNPKHKFIMRIGGIQQFSIRNVLASQWGANTIIHLAEDSTFQPSSVVSYDFKDTLKILVDDEGSNEPLTLNIYVDRERFIDPFRNEPGHMALHAEAEQWYSMMISRLARQ